MTVQVYPADLTVPAGTPASAPVSRVVPCPTGHIVRVILTIPAGHNGLTGWQLLLAGSIIVPYAETGFVVGNDHVYEWQLDREVNTGQLVVSGYNTGTFAHTFHCLAEWIPALAQGQVTATLATATPATDQAVTAIGGLTGFPEDETVPPDVPELAPDLETVG